MKLIHVIEKTFNSGAASSLKQIYDALSDSSFISEQEVVCVKTKRVDKNMPDFFPVPASYSTFESIINDAKSNKYNESVFVFHKLMCSPTKMFANLLWKVKRPYFVINHTYSDCANFNKLFNFTECVCVSEHMRKKMSVNNRNTNFYTIKNIVDQNFVSQFSCREVKDTSIFKTGRINSINAIKYSPDFIKWVSNLSLSKNHFHEYMGTGQYYNEAYTLAESCRKEKSHCAMIGAINNDEEKFSKLKSWDVFLYHINRPEGTSMAVLESLASGVPVVCSNLPGNNELIVNGVNGYVFDSFVEAESILNMLCSNNEKLESLKASTQNWAFKNLNKNYLKQQYEKVISSVIENFNNKTSGRSAPEKFVKLNKEARAANVRENIKQVIQNRVSDKKISKVKNVYPKNTYRNKHVVGSKIIKKRVFTSDVPLIAEVQKTFFPILSIKEIDRAAFMHSDMIGFSCSDNNDRDCFLLNAKNYADCDCVILHTDNYLIEKSNDLEKANLEKSDIIYVNIKYINNFKNLIISKSIWAEKEK